VNQAMRTLARDSRTQFIGQSVCFDGATIYDSLDGIPMERRLEMPVIEDFQLGYCLGLSLTGKIPICIFPRMDFMLLAMNQLINHLDKLPLYGWKPKVIMRTRVGSKVPLDAGPQHTQNYWKECNDMTCRIMVKEVRTPAEVTLAYKDAMRGDGSWLIVENPG
jgi:pyruvate/2-oxoglutarate/acetoin dehydrogenase E1 component